MTERYPQGQSFLMFSMRKYGLNCTERPCKSEISGEKDSLLWQCGIVFVFTMNNSTLEHDISCRKPHAFSLRDFWGKKRIVDWKTLNNRTWVKIPVRVQRHWQVVPYGKFHATNNKFQKPSPTISTMPRVYLSTPHALVNEQTEELLL